MNEKVLILSITPYDFTDDKTGKQIKGITCWLLPLNNQEDNFTNGIKPVKYSLHSDMEIFFEATKLPALGTMEFDFDFSRNRIKPYSFADLTAFELGDLIG